MNSDSFTIAGTWKGEYSFDPGYSVTVDRKTFFTIAISGEKGIEFSGTVEDDAETGGTKGTGTISGKFDGKNISFVKLMPVRTIAMPDGRRIEKSKPHPPIRYKGALNKENAFEGTWEIKRRLRFLGLKIYITGGKGSWKMKKA